MSFRRLLSFVAILLAAVMVVSCSRPTNGESPGSASSEHKVVEIGATGEPAGMDMITVDGAGTPLVLLYNVYETLVKLDEQRQPQPLLATSWELSEDRLTYTFTLDGAAKFADGTPVNAEAVVSSFQRILDGEGTNQIKADFAPLESAKAVDDKTVELKLKQPSNHFLFALTTPAGIVVNPAADAGALNKTPAGSGPYQLGEWEPGSHVQLVRNDNYWGTPPHFDEANFRFYADPNAMNNAMLSGQLDIVSNLTVPQALGKFSDKEKYTVIEGHTEGEVLLSYNHSNEALAKPEVRQALAHAIDKEALLAAAWAGKGAMIGSMVPPTEEWFEDLSGTYPHDPAKAKELLKAAGHESGLTLRLRVPTLPYAQAAARSVQAQLAEVGVKVEIDELDFVRWLDVVFAQGDYDMTIVAHIEPRDLKMYAMEGNYAQYDNPEFSKLIAEADQGTPEEFVSKQKEAAKILAEDAVAGWLFLLPQLIITKPDINGVPVNQTSLSFDVTLLASSR